MRARFKVTLLVGSLWLLTLGAAQCQPDRVQPGWYAAPDAGPATTLPVAPVGSGVGMQSEAQSSAADAGGLVTPRDAGGFSLDDAGPDAAAPACDLRGRWLVTHHDVVDGLGQLQTAHTWLYYEIAQQGERLQVSKGLHCGDEVVARTDLAANVDMHGMWPAVLQHDDDTGRQGTSRAVADGCAITFDKTITLMGATAMYYRDESHAFSTTSQQATATTPGWEDWDGDGNPGVTLNVSGAANGSVYAATRAYHQLSGTVASVDAVLRLADDWNQEEQVLGYTGSPLVTQAGVRAADATLHFVQMARLDATQATGDDPAICAQLRTLAKTLTPDAAQK